MQVLVNIGGSFIGLAHRKVPVKNVEAMCLCLAESCYVLQNVILRMSEFFHYFMDDFMEATIHRILTNQRNSRSCSRVFDIIDAILSFLRVRLQTNPYTKMLHS